MLTIGANACFCVSQAEAVDVITDVLERSDGGAAQYQPLARHLSLKLGAYVQHLALRFYIASPMARI